MTLNEPFICICYQGPHASAQVFQLIIPRAKLGPSVEHKYAAVFPMNAVSKQLNLFMDVLRVDNALLQAFAQIQLFPLQS